MSSRAASITPNRSATAAKFAAAPSPPIPSRTATRLSLHQHALQLYLEGISFRAIGRLLGSDHQTMSNWVTAAASALPAQVTDATPTATIELDELYTFVPPKKTRSTSSSPSPAGAG